MGAQSLLSMLCVELAASYDDCTACGVVWTITRMCYFILEGARKTSSFPQVAAVAGAGFFESVHCGGALSLPKSTYVDRCMYTTQWPSLFSRVRQTKSSRHYTVQMRLQKHLAWSIIFSNGTTKLVRNSSMTIWWSHTTPWRRAPLMYWKALQGKTN